MAHDVLKLVDQLAPDVRKAFLEVINDIKSEAKISVIAGHLENGNIEAAVVALHLREEFFAPLDEAMRAAYLRGGADALSGLPRLFDPFLGSAWLLVLMGEIHAQKTGSEPNPRD